MEHLILGMFLFFTFTGITVILAVMLGEDDE